MGRLFRNKIFLGTLCIILAAVVGFGIVPLFNASTRKTVMVYRAKETIYQYEQITDGMIEQVEVGAYGLPAGTVTDKTAVVGKYAKAEIVAGDNILAGQILSGGLQSGQFLNEISAQGKRAVSVTLPTTAAAVSGNIQTGDIVSVLTFESASTARTVTGNSGGFNNGIQNNQTADGEKVPVQYPDLKDLQIVAMAAKDGTPINGLQAATTGADGKASIQLPATVTFVCNDQQALELAQIEKKNDLFLVFVARGAQAQKIAQPNGKTS